jgi:hypothetical protein
MRLATGIPRYTHLNLNLDLPDSLLGDDIMVMRARLYLHVDPDELAGVGGHDRDSDGLSLRALATNEALDLDAPTFPEDDYYNLSSGIDLFGSDGQLIDPIAIPLTSWLQDWMNGTRENHGIILSLNGTDERPRCLSFFIDDMGPRLEILYTRRPDFE